MLNRSILNSCVAIRAGLNERKTPGKVVTARPPKRLAQLCSVAHALVSTQGRIQPVRLGGGF